jgi:hypothetical protein
MPTDYHTGKCVNLINIIVKQLKGIAFFHLTDAGWLTQATSDAVKSLLVNYAGNIKESLDKYQGKTQTFTMENGSTYHLNKSMGKHINAILTVMDWMKTNHPAFVKNRPLYLDVKHKISFFRTLQEVSKSSPDDYGYHQIEKLRIGPSAVDKFQNKVFTISCAISLANLILIGLNKNEQYVNAISVNYRNIRPSRSIEVSKPRAAN